MSDSDETTSGLFGASPETGAAYRVLARKYRPQTFDDLIGQDAMVRTLANAFESGRIAQAYMLTGVRGVGKTTTARLIARALNYTGPDGQSGPTVVMTGLGEHCKAIMESRHVDVLEMDAASNTGIDDVREIIEAVRYKPATARYKVYIIDEVHMLSKAAFNGLLKTLEEPPPHVKFIFATTEVRKVPVTVLSRCQRFDLRRVDAGLLIDHFGRIAKNEGVEVEEGALALIARASEGSVRDGLSLLDQAIAHASGAVSADEVRTMLGLVDRARVVDLFEHVMAGDVARALAELKEQYVSGADPAVVLADMAALVHWITRLKLVPDAAMDATMSQTERERGTDLAARLGMRVLTRAWQMLLKGITEVETAPNALAAADMVLVRMAHAADLPTLDEAIRQATGPAPAGEPAGRGAPEPAAPRGPVQQAIAREQVRPEHSEPVAAASDAPRLESFADVVAMVAAKRDIRLKTALERHVRLVGFAPGQVDISLDPGAPAGLANELGRKLQQWTGERWIIAVSAEKGARTIAEQTRDAEAVRMREAAAEPLVQAALKRFPGAAIVKVRDLADDFAAVDGDLAPPDDA
jgi:DNA polymerase-3 subunit gamma/tau